MGKRSVMGLLLTCMAALALTVPQAQAAGHKSPALDRPTHHGASVVFTGRATPRSKVRLQVRAKAGWKSLAARKADSRGAFKIAVSAPRRLTSYRVISQGQASVAKRVAPPAAAAAAPAPSATAKPAPTDACGTLVARAGGGTYSCTFVDNFDGSALNRDSWHVMDGTTSGAACMVDSPRTVAVSGGALHLTALPATDATTCPLRTDGTRASYMTGSVNTFWKWSQQYGRFEVRMKSQAVAGPGAQEAFWLWPDTRYASDATWPASGEIDVVENYSAYPTLAIPFLHYTANDNGGPVPGLNTAWNCLAPRGQWHTYLLDWSADRLSISVDGKTCLTNTKGAASFRKRFIMSFSQLLSSTGANTYLGTPILPVTLDVDYVKVWR
ncbi:hypothetical protein GCM10022237_35750 [Nocardioides ginsengisoli]|uniref:Family 16 glycosylhydrolase n=1 Tax=Nocardioides ginsengisoli TaxID=363868 RepID=A0ABW3VZP5_9ACTN